MTGRSRIGFTLSQSDGRPFHAVNPATGEKLQPPFYSATLEDADNAARLAGNAFKEFSGSSGKQKSEFLRRIAEQLERLQAEIVQRAHLETGLPVPRLQGELVRTCFQLRLFADLVEEGSWVEARIDHPDPERKPVPKPDVRSMLRPLGPVAVFGSSNFPLAFSVAGGDTASAFAAGCPVIVKAHPAHPGTSELAAAAIENAARQSDLPEGIFSLLFDEGYDTATALVKHQNIKAVGFTGSRRGGHTLMSVASSRPEPIPVFAEMGSVNPVFILPGAMRSTGLGIATGLHASVTLGVGQFCTNPGLVFVSMGEATETFLQELERFMTETPVAPMLTAGICSSYLEGVKKFAQTDGVRLRVEVKATPASHAGPALFVTDIGTFMSNPHLADEVFGPSTLIVECRDGGEMLEAARELEGQLTVTIHGTEVDVSTSRELITALQEKAGRVVFNGFPTGVEVCNAMVHGGPYPATSDGRSTSVGTRAIQRFTRSVSFQNFTDEMLPDELKESNPCNIWRLIDGQWTRS